jgi:DNA polymerase III alpha subunit
MSEEAHKDPVRLEHAPFYAELAAATNYSFLRGASHPSDMVARALELGMSGIGIADRNTVAGVVRAHAALKEARAKAMATGLPDPDFRLVVGARLVFADGTPDILAYPATRFGWGRLTRLLTQGNRRAEKGACILTLDDLLGHNEDLLLIAMPGANATLLTKLDSAAPGRIWLGAVMGRSGRDERLLAKARTLAARCHVPLIAHPRAELRLISSPCTTSSASPARETRRSCARGAGARPTRMVCFLLGVTRSIRPGDDLLFSRFISEERGSRPISTSISSMSGARR